EGPLVGLHAGLMSTETEDAAAIACDLSFVERALVAGLHDLAPGWSAIVPEALGNIHPLCAISHRSVGQTAEDLLRRGGGSLRRVLAAPALRVRLIPEEDLRKWAPAPRRLMNVNRPDDYDCASALFIAL